MARKSQKGAQPPGDTLEQAAYEMLMRKIMDRSLVGGAVIQERKMADAFGISRTPMRRALAKLEGEGLLIRLTDRLLSVKLVSLQECLDAMAVRLLIEPEAARLATGRIPAPKLEELKSQLGDLTTTKNPSRDMHWALDDNLHTAIAQYSGNKAILDTVAQLRRTTRMFEEMAVPQPTWSPGTEEHLKIIKAMQRGDPGKAAEAMRVHLVVSRKNVLGMLDQ
ncbi:GntR family transcriptional regulator [Povalibacter sp.]|uniref:GntR family transcriptional regulator n=1 Tax=Povalibacter sp. TaxID=1962978 RepID=UPI002F42E058